MELQKAFPVCRSKVFKEGEEDNADIYTISRVHKNRITLEAAPERIGRDLPESGDILFIESLLSDATYRMQVRVVDCLNATTVQLIVEQTGEIQRIQRRRYFRVETELPVCIVDRTANEQEPTTLITSDISAGGISAISESAMPEGHELILALDLHDGDKPFTCAATIRRCRPCGKDKYDLGIAFQNVSEHDADRLVQILLKIAREKINL